MPMPRRNHQTDNLDRLNSALIAPVKAGARVRGRLSLACAGIPLKNRT